MCNPHQAKKVLEANPEISTALPCRISRYEEGGVPQAGDDQAHVVIDLYCTRGFKAVAQEVEATLEALMAEAARWHIGCSS